MQLIKNSFCFVVTVLFVVYSVSNLQQAPNSDVQSEYDIERQYFMDLQEHREACYERILLLGVLSKRELPAVKRELEMYLYELQMIQQQMEQLGVIDELFQQMITLDKQFITNTLQAIDSQDERYLENLGELYMQLQDYHYKLHLQYVSQKD